MLALYLKALAEVQFRPFTKKVEDETTILANVFKGEMHFLKFQLPNIG